jgi:maltose 6'-phosphate phosphatase
MIKRVPHLKTTIGLLMFLGQLLIHPLTHAAEETVSVRVASYNVEYGKNASPQEIGAMFKPYNLDIIGFCEAPDGDWTRAVGTVLEMNYTYVGEISSANHKDKYKTILSRTPLEATQEFPIDGSLQWNPASAVRAETTIRGITIAFYSLHIAGSDGKTGHAKNFVENILKKEKAKRYIVVGDFNNRVGEEAINIVLRAGMNITWDDLHLDLTPLFTYNALKPEINGGVIDHIVYNTASNGKTTQGSIIELEKPLSDHKPIWAQITYPIHAAP